MNRQRSESQRQYVERVLAVAGQIRTYDVLYNLAFEDGTKCSISRLAAIVKELRDAGWSIDTHAPQGELATYVLRTRAAPVVAAAPRPLADWQRGWRCESCGAAPASEPTPLLADMGRGQCATCGAERYFWKAS